MAFDPKTLNTDELAEEGVWFDVLDYDGEPILDDGENVRIKIRGAKSKVVKDIIVQLARAGYKDDGNKSDAAFERMLSRAERANVRVAIAATVDWEHIGIDGEDVPCTPENCKKVYKDAEWLAQQVFNHTQEDSAFIKGSSKR